MTETQIQETIVAWLSAVSRRYGFLFFSVPNESGLLGGRTGSGLQFAVLARLKKMGLTPGVSDLVLGWRGRMFAVEVKTAKGTQSDRQRIFEAWCSECGIPYAVVRSPDEMMETMAEWGIIRPGAGHEKGDTP
jgi:hypothetical protein